MGYLEHKEILLNHRQRIMNLLGNEFDSNDFILAFKNLFPNEYANTLSEAKSYRTLHTWIANEILNKAYAGSITQVGERNRLSANCNPTINKVWKKI